jgi:hypothetical protein
MYPSTNLELSVHQEPHGRVNNSTGTARSYKIDAGIKSSVYLILLTKHIMKVTNGILIFPLSSVEYFIFACDRPKLRQIYALQRCKVR